MLREYDTTEGTITAQSIDNAIAGVTTVQSTEYTQQIRFLLLKQKQYLPPLDYLPQSRPAFDFKIPLLPDADQPTYRPAR